jgi:hypothetical protein
MSASKGKGKLLGSGPKWKLKTFFFLKTRWYHKFYMIYPSVEFGH